MSYCLLFLTSIVAIGNTESMKQSEYVKQMGVRYETAWRWYRDGNIQGRRVGPRTLIIPEGQEMPAAALQREAINARVASAENSREPEQPG
jgi:putative resolvase